MTSKRRTKCAEFSKRLTVFFIVVTLVLTAVAVVAALLGRDITYLATLVATWAGASTTCTAFYLWKAKNENRNKYAQMWVEKIGEKYGWEAAARFAEITLKGD